MSTVSIHTGDTGTFKKCRQQWDFSSSIRSNLEPIPSSFGALSFGTGIHLALEAYYKYGRMSVVAISVWNAFVRKFEEENSVEVLEEGDHSRTLGVHMLEYYHRWAKINDALVMVELEREVNSPFLRLRRPLGQYPTGTEILYSYRLDGLFKDKHGRYWIREYKTAGKFDATYDYLLIDDQAGKYLQREQARLGIIIEGVDYIILKKSFPKHLQELKRGDFSVDKRQDTDYETAYLDIVTKYEGKVPEKYQEFLNFLREKPNNFMRHIPVRRSQIELANIYQSMKAETKEMLDNPVIYRSPSAANCGNCAFLAPCVALWSGDDYKTILQLGYRKRESFKPVDLDGMVAHQ